MCTTTRRTGGRAAGRPPPLDMLNNAVSSMASARLHRFAGQPCPASLGRPGSFYSILKLLAIATLIVAAPSGTEAWNSCSQQQPSPTSSGTPAAHASVPELASRLDFLLQQLIILPDAAPWTTPDATTPALYLLNFTYLQLVAPLQRGIFATPAGVYWARPAASIDDLRVNDVLSAATSDLLGNEPTKFIKFPRSAEPFPAVRGLLVSEAVIVSSGVVADGASAPPTRTPMLNEDQSAIPLEFSKNLPDDKSCGQITVSPNGATTGENCHKSAFELGSGESHTSMSMRVGVVQDPPPLAPPASPRGAAPPHPLTR